MPTYYAQVLGLDLMKSGFFSVLPWCTMAFSANLGGWIADKLAARGTSITTVRKIMQSVGLPRPHSPASSTLDAEQQARSSGKHFGRGQLSHETAVNIRTTRHVGICSLM